MADGRPGDKDGKNGPEGGSGQGRRFGRRRGFRGRPRKDRPGEGQDKQGGKTQVQGPQDEALEGEPAAGSRPDAGRETPACPLCGKPVYDLSTALSSSQESGEPAHFDCVLDRVTAAETLENGEKIVYLGSGTFAVVVFKDRVETAFTVKRRIQWEKEGEKKEWRKGLSSRIANL
jgi:hypothetical protein